jgi:hypothetical protein
MFQHKYYTRNDTVYFRVVRRNGDTYTAKVDAEDFDKVAAYTWHIQASRNHYYAKTSWYEQKERIHLSLSRLVIGDPPEGYEITYANGDTFDCRKSNLVVATHIDIMQCTWQAISPVTKERGISYDRRNNRYLVNLVVRGQRYTSTRVDFAEAVKLRDALYTKHGYRVDGNMRYRIGAAA